MGDTMIITPTCFYLLLYMAILGVGIDFMISGIMVFKKFSESLEKPKLLGLRILRLNQVFFERMRRQNKIYQYVYSEWSIKFLTLLSGVLIIIGSLIQIFDIFFSAP